MKVGKLFSDSPWVIVLSNSFPIIGEDMVLVTLALWGAVTKILAHSAHRCPYLAKGLL